MVAFNPFYASFNFTEASTLLEGVHAFLSERNLVWHAIGQYWEHFIIFLSQPVVYSIILAWAITFTIVVAMLLNLGFGPIGIVASSAMAAFQSWRYRGFTPAGGLFATLTSLAMLGKLQPRVVRLAAFVATLVASIVWANMRST